MTCGNMGVVYCSAAAILASYGALLPSSSSPPSPHYPSFALIGATSPALLLLLLLLLFILLLPLLLFLLLSFSLIHPGLIQQYFSVFSISLYVKNLVHIYFCNIMALYLVRFIFAFVLKNKSFYLEIKLEIKHIFSVYQRNNLYNTVFSIILRRYFSFYGKTPFSLTYVQWYRIIVYKIYISLCNLTKY